MEKKLFSDEDIRQKVKKISNRGCECRTTKCLGIYHIRKFDITAEQRERLSSPKMKHIKCPAKMQKLMRLNRLNNGTVMINEVLGIKNNAKGALWGVEVDSCNSVEPLHYKNFHPMDLINDFLRIGSKIVKNKKPDEETERGVFWTTEIIAAYFFVSKDGYIEEYYESEWYRYTVTENKFSFYEEQTEIHGQMTKMYNNERERRQRNYNKKRILKSDKSLSSPSASQVARHSQCNSSKDLKLNGNGKMQSKGGKSKAYQVVAIPWNPFDDDSTELEDNMDLDDIEEDDENELEVGWSENVNEGHAEVENNMSAHGVNVVNVSSNLQAQNPNVSVEINPLPGINRGVSISTEVVKPSAPQSTFRFVNVDQTNSANKMGKQHDFDMHAKVTNVQLSSDNNQETPKMMNNFSKTNILIEHAIEKELGPELFQVSQSIFSTESEEQSNEDLQQFNQSHPENHFPINESNFEPTYNSEFKITDKVFNIKVAQNSKSLPVFMSFKSNLSKDVHPDLQCPKSISSNGSHCQTGTPSKEDQQLLSESLAKMKQAADVFSNSAQSVLIEYEMRIKKRNLDEATSYPMLIKALYDKRDLKSTIKSEFSSSPNTSFDTYVKSEFVPPGDESHYQDTNVTGGNLASQSIPSMGVTQPFKQMDQVNYQAQQKANASYKLATNLANNRQLNGNNHSNSKTSSETPSYHGNRVTNSINQTEFSSSPNTSFDVFDKSKFVTPRDGSHYQNSDVTRENFTSPLTTSMGVSQPFKQMDKVNYQVQQKANGSYKLATNLANNHQLNCNNPSILANSKTSSENQSYHGNGVLNSTNQTEFSSSLNTSFDIFDKSKYVPPRDGPICQDSNSQGGSIASRMDTTKLGTHSFKPMDQVIKQSQQQNGNYKLASPLTPSMGVNQPFKQMDQVNYQAQQQANESYKLATNSAINHQFNGNKQSNLTNSVTLLANQDNRVSNSTNQIEFSSSSKFVQPRDGPICQDSNHHGGSIASQMDTTKFVSQPFDPMDQVNYQTQLAANLANNHQFNGNNLSNLANSKTPLANQSYHGNRVSNSTNQTDMSSYPNNLNSANNNKDNHMNPGFNWRPEATSSACASHSNHNNNRNINPMEHILPTNMHAGLINVKTINQYMNVTMNNITINNVNMNNVTINNANANNAIMNNVTMNTSSQQIGPSSFSPNSSMYYSTEQQQQQPQMNNNLAPFVNEPQQNQDNEWQNQSVHSHTDTGMTHYSNCSYDTSSSFYSQASHSESYPMESTQSSTFMNPQTQNGYVQNSHAVTNDAQVPSASYNSQSIDNQQQSNPNSDSQGYNALVALNRQFGREAPINPFDLSTANYKNDQNQLSFVRQLGTNDHPLSIAQQNGWQDTLYSQDYKPKRQMVKQERKSSTIIPKQESQYQTVPGQQNMFQNAAQQSYHGNQHYSSDGYNPDAYGNSYGNSSGNSSGISQQQPYSQAFNEAYLGQINQSSFK